MLTGHRPSIRWSAPTFLYGDKIFVASTDARLVALDARTGKTAKISYYLSSLPPKVKTIARLIRQHWSIESRLHWVLDVTFAEDKSRIRKQHAPQISAMLRRLAVSILSSDTSTKDSLRGKRYRACLSTDVLERYLLCFIRN